MQRRMTILTLLAGTPELRRKRFMTVRPRDSIASFLNADTSPLTQTLQPEATGPMAETSQLSRALSDLREIDTCWSD